MTDPYCTPVASRENSPEPGPRTPTPETPTFGTPPSSLRSPRSPRSPAKRPFGVRMPRRPRNSPKKTPSREFTPSKGCYSSAKRVGDRIIITLVGLCAPKKIFDLWKARTQVDALTMRQLQNKMETFHLMPNFIEYHVSESEYHGRKMFTLTAEFDVRYTDTEHGVVEVYSLEDAIHLFRPNIEDLHQMFIKALTDVNRELHRLGKTKQTDLKPANVLAKVRDGEIVGFMIVDITVESRGSTDAFEELLEKGDGSWLYFCDKGVHTSYAKTVFAMKLWLENPSRTIKLDEGVPGWESTLWHTVNSMPEDHPDLVELQELLRITDSS